MKKALSLFLCMVMLLGLAVPFGVSAATPSTDYDSIMASVYDEATSTYTLTTSDHLLAFAYAVYNHGAKEDAYFAGKTIALGADITVNAGVQDAVAAGDVSNLVAWPDLGLKYFHGTFDGQGYTISGIYLSTATASTGIFGYGSGSATVKNLVILDSYVTSSMDNLGGIFGQVNTSTVVTLSNLYLDIDVHTTYTSTNALVGGAIGAIRSCSVDMDNVVSVGNITGSTSTKNGLGGLVGQVGGGDGSTVTIDNCAFYGTVTCYGTVTAGMVARVPTVTGPMNISINQAIVNATIKDPSDKLGGAAIGSAQDKTDCTYTFTNLFYTSGALRTYGRIDVPPTVTGGGLITADQLTGSAGTEFLKKNGFTNWVVAPGNPLPVSVYEMVYTPSTDYTAMMNAVYDASTATYTLATKNHLLAFAYLLNSGNQFSGKTVALAADITVNDNVQAAVANGKASGLIQWPDMGANKWFKGTLDGNGHTISGLYMATTAGTSSGLFGYGGGSAVVRDLVVLDSHVTSTKDTVGGIFGQVNTTAIVTLSNLYLDIDVLSTTATYVGGVIGTVRSCAAALDHIVVVGNVSGTADKVEHYFGGLIGQVGGGAGSTVTIDHCASYGSVTCYGNSAGGVIGYVPAVNGAMSITISNTVVNSAVTAADSATAGAIIGTAPDTTSCTHKFTNVFYTNRTPNAYGSIATAPTVTGGGSVTLDQLDKTFLASNGLTDWIALSDGPVPASVFEMAYDPTLSYDLIMETVYDEATKTYTLTTAKHLLAFAYSIYNHGADADAYFAGKTIALGADITVNKDVQATVENGLTNEIAAMTAWPDLGGKYFHGSIDGNGYTVSGLYMKSAVAKSGFFGYASSSGAMTVKDLAIVDSYAESSKAQFGGLFGYTNITSTKAGEGLLLNNLYLDIDLNSTLPDTSTSSTPSGSDLGGIIGYAYGARVMMDSVVVMGNLTANGTRYVGGLIGRMGGTAGSTVAISNCAYYGTITGATREVGMLVGRLYSVTVPSTLIIESSIAGGALSESAVAAASGALVGYTSVGAVPTVELNNNLSVSYKTATGTFADLYKGPNTFVPSAERNVLVTPSQLTTASASITLLENNMTQWKSQTSGPVLPVTVRDLFFPVTEAKFTKFVGYQLSEAEGARFTIRLIGVVDSLDYDAVGFKISLTCEDPEIGTKNRTQSCYTVYNILNGVGKDGTVRYTAESLGGKYIYALNINNVPVGCGNIDFLVRTYHKVGDEITYDGTTMAFTVDSSFADLSEQPLPGEGSDAPDYSDAPEATEPVETVYTDIGYRGLDVTVQQKATLSDYKAYVKELETQGYTKVSERVTAYNYFTQMDSETESLWVSYYGTKKQIRVSGDGQLLKLPQKETVANPVAATVTQYANYASQMEDQTVAPGMGYVLRADNGKLIVIDGAHSEDVDGFYALMQEIYGDEHPVIAAWIFTHAHNDHIEGAAGILEKYGDAMTVEAVYSSFLSKTYNDLDTANAADVETDLTALFAQIDRLAIPTVTVRTGMQFYVGGMLTSFLYAPDDLLYAGAPNLGSLNEHSLIFTVSFADEKVLFLGDAISQAEQTCTSNWSDREWDAEVCQVAHHGIQGVSSNLYKKIEPEVLLWTCNMVRYEYNYNRFEYIIYLHSLDVENIIAYNGTHTLTFGQFIS